jgi:hypothetical protein
MTNRAGAADPGRRTGELGLRGGLRARPQAAAGPSGLGVTGGQKQAAPARGVRPAQGAHGTRPPGPPAVATHGASPFPTPAQARRPCGRKRAAALRRCALICKKGKRKKGLCMCSCSGCACIDPLHLGNLISAAGAGSPPPSELSRSREPGGPPPPDMHWSASQLGTQGGGSAGPRLSPALRRSQDVRAPPPGMELATGPRWHLLLRRWQARALVPRRPPALAPRVSPHFWKVCKVWTEPNSSLDALVRRHGWIGGAVTADRVALFATTTTLEWRVASD